MFQTKNKEVFHSPKQGNYSVFFATLMFYMQFFLFLSMVVNTFSELSLNIFLCPQT